MEVVSCLPLNRKLAHLFTKLRSIDEEATLYRSSKANQLNRERLCNKVYMMYLTGRLHCFVLDLSFCVVYQYTYTNKTLNGEGIMYASGLFVCRLYCRQQMTEG